MQKPKIFHKGYGRPPKEKSEKRKLHRITINCTESEFEYISNLADDHNISKSNLCIRLIMNKKIPTIFKRDVADLNSQLRRIGGNINQISRSLNQLNKGGIMTIFKRKKLENDLENTIQEYRDILKLIMSFKA
ncbi:plasmid mobilization protein [Marinifilum fragile]|uniref:plasmid mobilization protein n=1 Tax=Marinifilum fragile TaxID=570161 RepID=UPI002AA6CD7A|nr:plasmid mobilization relaxosome protein MobC [Marinifilum fragile]